MEFCVTPHILQVLDYSWGIGGGGGGGGGGGEYL